MSTTTITGILDQIPQILVVDDKPDLCSILDNRRGLEFYRGIHKQLRWMLRKRIDAQVF